MASASLQNTVMLTQILHENFKDQAEAQNIWVQKLNEIFSQDPDFTENLNQISSNLNNISQVSESASYLRSSSEVSSPDRNSKQIKHFFISRHN